MPAGMQNNQEATRGGPLADLRAFWMIVLAALLLALAAAWSHRGDRPCDFKGDDMDYHRIATNLVQHGVFPSTFRAPGYPAFIAAVYAGVGERPFAVYVFQALLFASSVLLTGLSFEQITRNCHFGLAAAAASAAFPLFYWMVARLLTETLALFLISLLVWLILRAMVAPRWPLVVLVGLVFAGATLTKATLQPFAAAIVLCLLLVKPRRVGMSAAATFIATVVIVMTPWTARNFRVTGAVLPVSTGAGVIFWMGNYPGNYDERRYATNRMVEFPQLPFELRDAVQGMTELQRDHYLKQIAVGYIREDPLRAITIFLRKFSDLWLGNLGANPSIWPTGRRPLFAAGKFGIGPRSLVLTPVFCLAVIGVVLMGSASRRRALPVLLLLACFTASHVATLAISRGRYALPVYPCVLGFAAIGAARLWHRFAHRRKLRS